MDKHKEWLSEEEAATYLGRSVGTLQQWRHKDRGPRYYKDPHGGIRYAVADLDEWIMGGTDPCND